MKLLEKIIANCGFPLMVISTGFVVYGLIKDSPRLTTGSFLGSVAGELIYIHKLSKEYDFEDRI